MRHVDSFDTLIKRIVVLCENSDNTPVAWPSKKPSDQEDAEELLLTVESRVKRGRFKVSKRIPTVGIFLQYLKTIFTWDVQTMAVDDKGNIYINPTFCDFLSDDEIMGVLVHEAMHVFTKTFWRQKGRDMRLWNVCTDYLMNYYIVKDGMKLPSGGCIPDGNGDVYFKDSDNNTHVFNIIGKTAEWLYARAVKLYKTPPDGSGGSGKPNESDKPSKPGQSDKLDKSDKPGDPTTTGGSGDPVPIDPSTGKPLVPTDDDKAPANPTIEEGSKKPNTKTLTDDDIKSVIRSSIRTANQANRPGGSGRGEGGDSDLENIIVSQTESKTDYKMLLKRLSHDLDVKYNWRRMSKRGYAVGSWIPKMVTSNKLAKITVAIDTSASISDKMVSQIIAECIKITRSYPNIELDVIKWTTNVYFYETIPAKLSSQKIQDVIASSTKQGGTLLSCVAEFYKTKIPNSKDYPKAILYFTDGYVEDSPTILPEPVSNFFLIIPGGSDTQLKRVKRATTHNIEV